MATSAVESMMPLFDSIVAMGSSYLCALWLWKLVILIISVLTVMMRIGRAIWWRPSQIRNHLEMQGISGPPYKFLFGNIPEMQKMLKEAKSKPMELSHRILPRVMPHCHAYYKYGVFSFSIQLEIQAIFLYLMLFVQ